MQSKKRVFTDRYFLFAVGSLLLVLNSGVFAERGAGKEGASVSSLQNNSADLKPEGTKARLHAIESLASGGSPQAVDLLIDALNDSDFQIRVNAATALAQTGDRRAVGPLLKALDDFIFHVRAAAAAALGRIPATQSIIPLFTALGDKHTEVAEQAARSLQMLGISGAVTFYNSIKWSDKAIEDFVKAVDWRLIDYILSVFPRWEADTRETAIWILGKIHDDRITDFLVENLASKNSKIRAAATWSLYEFGASRAAQALIPVLDDHSYWVREAAAYALGKTGDLAGVRSLVSLLQSDHRSEVRKAAASSLGEKFDNRSLNALAMALNDKKEEVRIAAASSLGNFAAPSAVDSLIPALKDKIPKVRETAVKSLSKIGGYRTVNPLITALEDASPIVRRAAAEGLGEVGNINARNSLIRALADDDPQVRRLTSLALKQLGEPLGPLIYAVLQGDSGALTELIKIKDHRASTPMIAALSHRDYRFRKAAARYLGEVKEVKALSGLTKMAAGLRIVNRVYGMAALAKLTNTGAIKIIYSGFKILFSVWTILYFVLITILVPTTLYIISYRPAKQSAIIGISFGSLVFGFLFSLPAFSFSINYVIYLIIGLVPFSIAKLLVGRHIPRFVYQPPPKDLL